MEKIQCQVCGTKKYGYMDESCENIYWICYRCGSFEGKANPKLIEDFLYNPQKILILIKEKKVIPID